MITGSLWSLHEKFFSAFLPNRITDPTARTSNEHIAPLTSWMKETAPALRKRNTCMQDGACSTMPSNVCCVGERSRARILHDRSCRMEKQLVGVFKSNGCSRHRILDTEQSGFHSTNSTASRTAPSDRQDPPHNMNNAGDVKLGQHERPTTAPHNWRKIRKRQRKRLLYPHTRYRHMPPQRHATLPPPQSSI